MHPPLIGSTECPTRPQNRQRTPSSALSVRTDRITDTTLGAESPMTASGCGVGANRALAWATAAAIVSVLLVGWAAPVSSQDRDRPEVESTRSATDWATVIDSTWGEGMPAAEQLDMFDRVINDIETGYGAFHNIDLNLASIRNRYRPEIASGVSRGRFAAIMNHISLVLTDCHTYIVDRQVSWHTAAVPGVPLFVVGAWPNASRFGASLTVLPDDTLLVFRALPDQQLGLEPGDIVLGYDGVPWAVLYRQLLDAELPIQLVWVCGSTEESMHHCMMMSAGLNWHLFDSIDVVKHRTGETLHLPTAPLLNQNGTIYGNEQLPVPGVTMPAYEQGEFVSWGIVEDTDIGYIYVASWDPDPLFRISEEFRDAVQAVMVDHDTEGLILDFRINTGGGALTPDDGFALLFDEDVYTIGYALRVEGSVDPREMEPHPELTPELLKIKGDPSTFYDRPIAVLIGPGSVSAGDVHAQRLLAHPMVKTFGKPSNGGFTLNDNPDYGPRWWTSRATGAAFTVDGARFLAHTGVPVDVEVWLEPEDAASGRDTVVEAAIAWIQRPIVRQSSGRRVPGN